MRVRPRVHAARVIWAPSRARRLLRHRATRVGVVVALGLLTGIRLVSTLEELDQQRADWGSSEVVLVVTERIEPGELVADSVETQELPVALMASGSVDHVGSDSRAKVTMFPGEIVIGERVTAADDEAGSVELPGGTVALTVPIVRLVPLLAEGDLVDLWTVDSANFSSRRVATNVLVLALSDDDITVAIPQDDVGAVALASLRPVTVALVG